MVNGCLTLNTFLKTLSGKKILIILKSNGFKYITSDFQIEGDYLRFIDIIGKSCFVSISDISGIQEVGQ